MIIRGLADGDDYNLQISDDPIADADADAFSCANIDIAEFTRYATFSVTEGVGRTRSKDINAELNDGLDEEAIDMDQRIAAVLDANNNIQACCILEYTDTQGN